VACRAEMDFPRVCLVIIKFYLFPFECITAHTNQIGYLDVGFSKMNQDISMDRRMSKSNPSVGVLYYICMMI